MKMKTGRADIRFLLFFLGLFPLFLMVKPVYGAVRCETQYGGRQVCVTTGQLQVNKEVFCDKALPGNDDEQICKDDADGFIDNLGLNFHRFAPGEEVRFRITVKNVGDATFSKVTVTDTPPSTFLSLSSGSLSFDLTDLKPGESQSRELKLTVVNTDQLPQNSAVCVVNAAEAKADNESDRDTSQVCLERKVLGVEKGAVPVKELPTTGAETWLLSLGSISGLLAGVKLMRFRKREFERSYFQIAEDRFNMKEGGE